MVRNRSCLFMSDLIVIYNSGLRSSAIHLAPVLSSSTVDQTKIYIAHLMTNVMPSPFSSYREWHGSILSSISSSGPYKPVHLYSYEHAANGFSTALSEAHVKELRRHANVLAVFGEGITVGILDTGVWPEIEGLRDTGSSPVPKHWRGTCENGENFNSSMCNRKLIGSSECAYTDKSFGGDYTVYSGTSYAAPHVVGIAALLKKQHPEWSSAAIRSALMTTADNKDNGNSPLSDVATGGGRLPLSISGLDTSTLRKRRTRGSFTISPVKQSR